MGGRKDSKRRPLRWVLKITKVTRGETEENIPDRGNKMGTDTDRRSQWGAEGRVAWLGAQRQEGEMGREGREPITSS